MSNVNQDSFKFKWLLPQIFASCVSTSYFLSHSTAVTFPTFLIPALEREDSDIKVTVSQSSWTATVTMLTLTVSSLCTGAVVQRLGAINSLRLGCLPGLLGWILVAVGQDITTLLIGRFFIGVSISLGGASIMYVTEITHPSIRASVLNTVVVYVSVGFVVSNFTGYFVHWRTMAWINNVYLVIPTLLMSFMPESPIWLVHKGRNSAAKKALLFFNKYHPDKENVAELQYEQIISDYKKRTERVEDGSIKDVFKSFLKPTGYKPLLLVIGMFFFLQSSGVYIVLIYAIVLFKNIDTGIDVNIIPGIFSAVRIVTSILLLFVMKFINKRTLMMFSTSGMAGSMLMAALFTLWLKEGTTTLNWAPLLLTIFYLFFALCGLVPIPWTSTSEIFPTNIRGWGQGVAMAIANGFFALALQNYRPLEQALGSTEAILFFFSGMSHIAILFMWFFLPETHNKKLIEIEEYFEHNWIYRTKKHDYLDVKKEEDIKSDEMEVAEVKV